MLHDVLTVKNDDEKHFKNSRPCMQQKNIQMTSS